jgi:hypothetical protein
VPAVQYARPCPYRRRRGGTSPRTDRFGRQGRWPLTADSTPLVLIDVRFAKSKPDTQSPVPENQRQPMRHPPVSYLLDAQLTEGLAVRYADAEVKRRGGVGPHGGLIDNGNVLRGCMSRMFAAIETNHSITSEQIRVAPHVGIVSTPLATAPCRPVRRWHVAVLAHRRVVPSIQAP